VVCFENLVPDLNKGEGVEPFDVKKISKKTKKKLRRGGSPADHRAGAAPAPPPSSSPIWYLRERRGSFEILEREWRV
jgi:hypothetical protein